MNEKPLLMVIDDEAAITELVGDAAKLVGFEVKTTTKVTEFLQLHEELKPAVVVSDLCIPEMDGIELLQALSDRGSRAGIILMSGYAGRYIPLAESMVDGLNLHHLGSIDKPFRLSTLKELLEASMQWCVVQTSKET